VSLLLSSQPEMIDQIDIDSTNYF